MTNKGNVLPSTPDEKKKPEREFSSVINRADLLRCLLAGNSLALGDVADAIGYVKVADSLHERLPIELPQTTPTPEISHRPDDEAFTELPPIEQEKMHFYRVVKRKALSIDEESSGTGKADYPAWYQMSEDTLLEDEHRSWIPDHSALAFQPLVPWARLWPFLKTVLSHLHRGRDVDVKQVVNRMARGEFIRQIPLKQNKAWAGTARVLIDINKSTFPFRYDFIDLRDHLFRLRGEHGLQVRYLKNEPGGDVYYWAHEEERVEPWQVPPPEMPLLIISDLGILSASRRRLYRWLVFGRELALKGCRPVVLMPVPVRMIDARLLRYFDCVSWDRGISRLKPVLNVRADGTQPEIHRSKTRELLNRVSPAVRVSSTLLRATRYLRSTEKIDVGHEAAVWQHPAIQSYGDQFVWQPADHERFLQAFRELPDEQQQAMIDLIGRYHAGLPEVLYFEAMQNCIQLSPELVDAGVKQATLYYMAALVRTYNEHEDYTPLGRWTGRFLARQRARVLKENNPVLAAIHGIHLKRNSEAGQDVTVPSGIDQAAMEPFLSDATQVSRYELRQQGRNLHLLPTSDHTDSDDFGVQSSLLATLKSGVDFLVKHSQTETGLKASHYTRFAEDKTVTVAMAGTRSYALETDREQITVEPFTRPEWAVAIGQVGNGLYAKSEGREGAYYWYWHPPEWSREQGMLPGLWYQSADLPGEHDLSSSMRLSAPPRYGRDQYGFYEDVVIGNLIQRFRWIEPTTFLMGSPEDEAGRSNNETQHQVTLSQGYWLADTTCTQQLWEAVMGKNPSLFKNENNPVENVSWDDIQTFLQRINKQYPELKLRLPTEAEWENACRAGAETPFHFGGKDDLNLEQVNYSGGWDEAGWDEKAHQQSQPVKSYPPNQWGLYEMHGNVLEWCQDRYGKYPEKIATDPVGPDTGVYRVLRGGSWDGHGWRCRSACRNYWGPDDRGYLIGFRLAQGHELQPVRTVRAGQQRIGSLTTGEEGGQAGADRRPTPVTPKPEQVKDKPSKSMLERARDFLKR